jgi:hypothetical protein
MHGIRPSKLQVKSEYIWFTFKICVHLMILLMLLRDLCVCIQCIHIYTYFSRFSSIGYSKRQSAQVMARVDINYRHILIDKITVWTIKIIQLPKPLTICASGTEHCPNHNVWSLKKVVHFRSCIHWHPHVCLPRGPATACMPISSWEYTSQSRIIIIINQFIRTSCIHSFKLGRGVETAA